MPGFFGLLLAVPATATLKIVCGHVWRHYVLGEPLDEIEARWEAEDVPVKGGVIERIGDEESATPPETRRGDGAATRGYGCGGRAAGADFALERHHRPSDGRQRIVGGGGPDGGRVADGELGVLHAAAR